MKFKAILIIAATFLATSMNAQNEVTVVIPNIKSIQGTMFVCLVAEKADYLNDCQNGQQVKVKDSEMTIVFQDVPTGEYAVTMFHDKNDDGKMNTNFVGIPKEPFGFSNNPGAMFGPPSYEKCLFDVKGDKKVTVKL